MTEVDNSLNNIDREPRCCQTHNLPHEVHPFSTERMLPLPTPDEAQFLMQVYSNVDKWSKYVMKGGDKGGVNNLLRSYHQGDMSAKTQ